MLFSVLMLCIYGVWDQCVASTETPNIGIKLSHGIYLWPIKNSIIFQSSMPLLFQADMPQTTFFSPITFDDLCSDTAHEWTATETSEFYCGKGFDVMRTANLIAMMDKETYQFQQSTLNDIKLHEMDYIGDRSKRGLIDPLRAALGEIAQFCCGLATDKQFNQLFANQDELNDVINSIKHLVHENHRHFMAISDNIGDMSKKINNNFQQVKDQFDNFKSQFRNMTQFTHAWSELISHSLVQLFARNVENTRQFMRSKILDDCRNSLIPSMIVTQDNLLNELINIKNKIEAQG